MRYPSHILPKTYHKLIDSEQLVGLWLVRMYPVGEDGLCASELTEKLVADPTKNICDYSTNLLGFFRIKDLYFKIDHKIGSPEADLFLNYWEATRGVSKPLYRKDFSLLNKVCCFFLNIKDFHDIYFEGNDDQNDKFYSRVEHSPTCCNYWHCSIKWYSDNEEITASTASKGKQRRITTTARLIVRERSQLHLSEETAKIDLNNFTNKKYIYKFIFSFENFIDSIGLRKFLF